MKSMRLGTVCLLFCLLGLIHAGFAQTSPAPVAPAWTPPPGEVNPALLKAEPSTANLPITHVPVAPVPQNSNLQSSQPSMDPNQANQVVEMSQRDLQAKSAERQREILADPKHYRIIADAPSVPAKPLPTQEPGQAEGSSPTLVKPAVKMTVDRTALESMSKEKQTYILSHPEEYNIVEQPSNK